MNQPVYPQQPQQPWQQPQQGYPQPQQGYQPQQTAYPPQQQQQPFQPAPNLGQAAAGNLFNQFLTEPPRKRANRAKPADGTYVIQFTPNCKMDFSQKDGRPFVLLEYRVVEGTVPQMQGQIFTVPIFWSNRLQLQDLADLAKYTFGQGLPNVAQQAAGNPQSMAGFVAQTLLQGYFAGVRIQRSQKAVQQVGYEQAFANHNWIVITPPNQPITLAQLNVQATPSMPPMQAPGMMQQPPQQFQQPPGQTMMPQPSQPAGFQPPPAPGMFQPPPQAPQQSFPQAPQQSFPQSPPVQYPQAAPQAPALPQVPPQQPMPAFYVPPGGQPQR
jgi:hypothetical protein